MTQAIVMVDRDGVICVWNQGAEDLFGYDAASAVGRTLDLIVPEAYRERHWSGFRAAMSTGSTKLDQPAGHLPTLRADGSVVRLPGRLIFLKDARGDAVGAVGIFSSNEGWDGPALPHILRIWGWVRRSVRTDGVASLRVERKSGAPVHCPLLL